MEHEIETCIPVDWKYYEAGLDAVCRIDNNPAKVNVTFRKIGFAFHDCIKLRAWLMGRLKQPTTAEELAEAIAVRFHDYGVTVEWRTESHGPITVMVPHEVSD